MNDVTIAAASGQTMSLPDPAVVAPSAKRQQLPGKFDRAGTLAVWIFGIIIPVLVLILSFSDFWQIQILPAMLLRPIATTIEVCLVSLIPTGMAVLWMGLSSKKLKLRLRHSFLGGLIVGVCICVIAVAGMSPLLSLLMVPAGCSALVCSIFVTGKIQQNWEFDRSRRLAMICTCAGALVSVLLLVAVEARPSMICVAESLATSQDARSKAQGLSLLRSLDCARELLANAEGSGTGGILPALLPVDRQELAKVAFAVTGRSSASPAGEGYDEAVATQRTGPVLPQLSVARSLMYVIPNARNLTSAVQDTFVFRNDCSSAQEARLALRLPQGSVIRDMTFWMDGKPKRATICGAATARNAYKSIVTSMRDPALVTDLGNNIAFIQCFPVPAHGEAKISLSIVEPMSLTQDNRPVVSLPAICQSNCLVGATNTVQIQSEKKPQCPSLPGNFHLVAGAGGLYEASVPASDNLSESLCIAVGGTISPEPARLKGEDGTIIQRQIARLPGLRGPSRLIAVVDSSAALKSQGVAIIDELAQLSKNTPCSVIFAGDSAPVVVTIEAARALAGSSGIFDGGHDNTAALVRACELSSHGLPGAVIWIHGPQPGFDQEVYPVGPTFMPAAIYEVRVAAEGSPAGSLLLRNHKELGTIMRVFPSSDAVHDLERVKRSWNQPITFVDFSYARGSARATTAMKYDSQADCLAAYGECLRRARINPRQAMAFAINKHIVSPLTAAVVLETTADYERNRIKEATPSRQGSTHANHAGGNPSTAWDISRHYHLRFPFAKESSRSDNAIFENTLTTFAYPLSDAQFQVIDRENKARALAMQSESNPVFTWPVPVPTAVSKVSDLRDQAIEKDLFQTFGLPISDTQYQIIDRYNKQRLLELLCDPERLSYLLSAKAFAANVTHVSALALALFSNLMILCPIAVGVLVLLLFSGGRREAGDGSAGIKTPA